MTTPELVRWVRRAGGGTYGYAEGLETPVLLGDAPVTNEMRPGSFLARMLVFGNAPSRILIRSERKVPTPAEFNAGGRLHIAAKVLGIVLCEVIVVNDESYTVIDDTE